MAEFRYQVEESPPLDYRTWSYIEPEQLEVESPYGTWTAKIRLKGKELEGLHFEVVP